MVCLIFEVLTFQSLPWGARGWLLEYAKAAACRGMQRGLLDESKVVLWGERVCVWVPANKLWALIGTLPHVGWGEQCHCFLGDHIANVGNVVRKCISRAWAAIVSSCVGECPFFSVFTVINVKNKEAV